jgi:hypothetical protein
MFACRLASVMKLFRMSDAGRPVIAAASLTRTRYEDTACSDRPSGLEAALSSSFCATAECGRRDMRSRTCLIAHLIGLPLASYLNQYALITTRLIFGAANFWEAVNSRMTM